MIGPESLNPRFTQVGLINEGSATLYKNPLDREKPKDPDTTFYKSREGSAAHVSCGDSCSSSQCGQEVPTS